ncbi:MAG TPA: hypothetical protein VJJ81_02720 [Candidatus Babeliales bacterium]|nr:hypothetical protein [Candidatus Babeliales bacterium]
MKKPAIVTSEIQAIRTPDIAQTRAIFITYFTDLYKEQSPAELGIVGPIATYLNNIFIKTEQALLAKRLQLAFAYIANAVVGITTYKLCADGQVILIRTLPISLAYKEQELAIRSALIQHVSKQYSSAQKILVMVRKANIKHAQLCLQGGFKFNNTVFATVDCIKTDYSACHYDAYVYG